MMAMSAMEWESEGLVGFCAMCGQAHTIDFEQTIFEMKERRQSERDRAYREFMDAHPSGGQGGSRGCQREGDPSVDNLGRAGDPREVDGTIHNSEWAEIEHHRIGQDGVGG